MPPARYEVRGLIRMLAGAKEAVVITVKSTPVFNLHAVATVRIAKVLGLWPVDWR